MKDSNCGEARMQLPLLHSWGGQRLGIEAVVLLTSSARYRRPKARALAVSALAAHSSVVSVGRQPATAHAFTSRARRFSSSTSSWAVACASAHSGADSAPPRRAFSASNSLARAWSTSGTIGGTSQRKGLGLGFLRVRLGLVLGLGFVFGLARKG